MDEQKNIPVNTESEKPSKKKHKYDIFVLLACLVIAVGIWLYVMNTSQEVVDKEITLTVDVSGQIFEATGMTIFSNLDDSFEGSNMDYSKLNVVLRVSGPKNLIDRYKTEDYKVTVDTDEIQGAAVQRLSFSYDMPSPEITFKSVETLLPTDMLYIDKSATATLTMISAELKNSVSAGTDVTMTPNIKSLNISGPERTINSITRATIVVDLTGVTASSTISSNEIKIYGVDGEIKSSYVNIEPESVNVDVVIETARTFPLTFKQTTVADEEYTYTVALSGEVSEIVLYGDTALMTFENFVIDLGDIKTLQSGEIKVSELSLPEGLVLGEGMSDLTVSYIITKVPIGSGGEAS